MNLHDNKNNKSIKMLMIVLLIVVSLCVIGIGTFNFINSKSESKELLKEIKEISKKSENNENSFNISMISEKKNISDYRVGDIIKISISHESFFKKSFKRIIFAVKFPNEMEIINDNADEKFASVVDYTKNGNIYFIDINQEPNIMRIIDISLKINKIPKDIIVELVDVYVETTDGNYYKFKDSKIDLTNKENNPKVIDNSKIQKCLLDGESIGYFYSSEVYSSFECENFPIDIDNSYVVVEKIPHEKIIVFFKEGKYYFYDITSKKIVNTSKKDYSVYLDVRYIIDSDNNKNKIINAEYITIGNTIINLNNFEEIELDPKKYSLSIKNKNISYNGIITVDVLTAGAHSPYGLYNLNDKKIVFTNYNRYHFSEADNIIVYSVHIISGTNEKIESVDIIDIHGNNLLSKTLENVNYIRNPIKDTYIVNYKNSDTVYINNFSNKTLYKLVDSVEYAKISPVFYGYDCCVENSSDYNYENCHELKNKARILTDDENIREYVLNEETSVYEFSKVLNVEGKCIGDDLTISDYCG